MKFLSSFTLLTFVAVALGYGLTSVTGQEALVAALVEGGVVVEVEDPVGGAVVEDEESAGVQSILNPVRPVGFEGSVGGAGVEDETSAGVQAYPKVPKRKTARKKRGKSHMGLWYRKINTPKP